MTKVDAGQTSDEQMVMTSFRITKAQARGLELVADLTGRTKAELVREALDEKFAELTTTEAVEAMVATHRERLLRQQEELRKAFAGQ
jgi:predicted DNA-binding protein